MLLVSVPKIIQIGVMANLLLSFAQAPFPHAHASDPHREHSQGFTHTLEN